MRTSWRTAWAGRLANSGHLVMSSWWRRIVSCSEREGGKSSNSGMRSTTPEEAIWNSKYSVISCVSDGGTRRKRRYVMMVSSRLRPSFDFESASCEHRQDSLRWRGREGEGGAGRAEGGLIPFSRPNARGVGAIQTGVVVRA